MALCRWGNDPATRETSDTSNFGILRARRHLWFIRQSECDPPSGVQIGHRPVRLHLLVGCHFRRVLLFQSPGDLDQSPLRRAVALGREHDHAAQHRLDRGHGDELVALAHRHRTIELLERQRSGAPGRDPARPAAGVAGASFAETRMRRGLAVADRVSTCALGVS